MLDSTEAYGLNLLYPAGDNTVGASLKRYEEFARPEVDLLLDYARGETGTFIDVGANIGAICLPFAKARPAWKLVAIEAHRGLANVLAANTFNNRLYNVEPVHAAAGAEMRLVNFPAPSLALQANHGTMSLARPAATREPVPRFRLDDLAPRSTAVIKIDVDGYEPEVLKGAQGLLAAKRTVWLAEAADQLQEASQSAVAAFLAAGYQVFRFFAPFVTPSCARGKPENPALGDSNILALPPRSREQVGLSPVTTPDAKRPRDPASYSYLTRYGY